jgi:large subunit ribosomal protein L1
VTAVKRVTGNQKDTEEKGKSKSVKPGEFIVYNIFFSGIFPSLTERLVNAITRVMLSSTQAPSIQISDI